MTSLNEAYEIQNFKVKPVKENKSFFSNICEWLSRYCCCCCKKKIKLSPNAQHYLDNHVGVGPVPPEIIEELKKYREENKINIILTKEEAQNSFNNFNNSRNQEIIEVYKTSMNKHYIDKNTNKLSEKLSKEARDFLTQDNGFGKIPPNILNELTEFRKMNEFR